MRRQAASSVCLINRASAAGRDRKGNATSASALDFIGALGDQLVSGDRKRVVTLADDVRARDGLHAVSVSGCRIEA